MLEVCVPKCHFLGTGFSPKNSGNSSVPSIWEHPSSHLVSGWETFRNSRTCSELQLIILFSVLSRLPSLLSTCIGQSRICLYPRFFLDFPEQRDQKEVVLSWSWQFGNCPPGSPGLILFKKSSGTQTSTICRCGYQDRKNVYQNVALMGWCLNSFLRLLTSRKAIQTPTNGRGYFHSLLLGIYSLIKSWHLKERKYSGAHSVYL